MEAQCENVKHQSPRDATYLVKVRVGPTRHNWPTRLLCTPCASEATASGRVTTMYHCDTNPKSVEQHKKRKAK